MLQGRDRRLSRRLHGQGRPAAARGRVGAARGAPCAGRLRGDTTTATARPTRWWSPRAATTCPSSRGWPSGCPRVLQLHSAQYRNAASLPLARCWWSARASRARRSPKTCISRGGRSSRGRIAPRCRASIAAGSHRLAGRHGLLRIPVRNIRCAKASPTRPTTTSPAATAGTTSTCAVRTRGHAALRRACRHRRREVELRADLAAALDMPTRSTTAINATSTGTSPTGAGGAAGQALVPVWEPAAEREQLDLGAPESRRRSGASASRPTSVDRPPAFDGRGHPRTSAASRRGRPVLPGPAMAAHLGLGPLFRRRARCAVPGRAHRAPPGPPGRNPHG